MADDWRVTVKLPDDDPPAARLLQMLHEHEVEEDVRKRLGQRIAVSAGDSHVFLYASSREAAQEAERVLREVVAARNLTADFAVDRWHPLAQEWEDANAALPQTAGRRQAEHQHLEETETKESQATGLAEWEVRVEL